MADELPPSGCDCRQRKRVTDGPGAEGHRQPPAALAPRASPRPEASRAALPAAARTVSPYQKLVGPPRKWVLLHLLCSGRTSGVTRPEAPCPSWVSPSDQAPRPPWSPGAVVRVPALSRFQQETFSPLSRGHTDPGEAGPPRPASSVSNKGWASRKGGVRRVSDASGETPGQRG